MACSPSSAEIFLRLNNISRIKVAENASLAQCSVLPSDGIASDLSHNHLNVNNAIKGWVRKGTNYQLDTWGQIVLCSITIASVRTLCTGILIDLHQMEDLEPGLNMTRAGLTRRMAKADTQDARLSGVDPPLILYTCFHLSFFHNGWPKTSSSCFKPQIWKR